MDEYNNFGIFVFISIKKGKNVAQMQKRFEVYGEGTVNNEMCQNWFVKFCARDFC